MSEGIVLTVSFLIFHFQALQQIMKWDSLINLFTLYKAYIELNIDLLLVILFYP